MHSQLVSPPKSLLPSNSYGYGYGYGLPSRSLLAASNPNPLGSTFTQKYRVVSCRGIEVSGLNSCSSFINSGNNGSFGKLGVNVKDVDIATLGNLCVDIVLNVPELPPQPVQERMAFMDRLAASPPDKKYWEAGGHCNTAIAAARLGLRCTAIGHVGNDIYGRFLLDVLHDEGIGFVKMSDIPDSPTNTSPSYETLLCWVLVDPLQRHDFLSRADFNEEPAFSWMNGLKNDVKLAIKQSKILVINGYGFDELSPGLIVSAMKYAVDVGTCIFFDPGPRGKSLSVGSLEEQMALSKLLEMSDVLLLTFDEAESLTGISNPILAGQELLKRGHRTKSVIIKMGSKGSVLITLSGTSCAPSFKAKVIDTVGCGDSFVAAVAFGFVHKMSSIHTLAIANAVGAATAMGCGAGRNVATLAKTLELIKTGHLNENDKFWRELLVDDDEENTEAKQEVTLLSSRPVNGVDYVPLEKVIPELATKLESAKLGPRSSTNITTV